MYGGEKLVVGKQFLCEFFHMYVQKSSPTHSTPLHVPGREENKIEISEKCWKGGGGMQAANENV